MIDLRVRTVISEQLGVDLDEVTTDAMLGEQLGADSLDAIELTLALEDAFAIEIPDEDAQRLLRVSDVIAYVQQRAGAGV